MTLQANSLIRDTDVFETAGLVDTQYFKSIDTPPPKQGKAQQEIETKSSRPAQQ